MKKTLLFIIFMLFSAYICELNARTDSTQVPATPEITEEDSTEDKDFYTWDEMCETDSEKVAESKYDEYWEDFDEEKKHKSESKHSNWNWDWDWSNDFSSGLSIFDWDYSRQAISLNYSAETKYSLNNGKSTFNKPGSIEAKIGSTSFKIMKRYGEVVSKYKYNYVQGGLYNQEYGKTLVSGRYTTETIRAFAGYEDGYGYKFGPSGLALYSGLGFGYTRMRVQDAAVPEELKIFHNEFKFGTKAEAGAKLMLIPNLSFDVAYERTTLHPRVLFWKAAGSYILEGASLGLVDDFVDAVFKSTPSIAPVLNFILKNAVSYGWTELRKEKVTFPFDSATPLILEQFKFGVTFMF